MEKISEEMGNMRRLLEILARDALRKELEAVATTPERRRIYALSDGTLTNEEIAKKSGLSLRAVQDVVKKLVELDLATMVRRGVPKRRFDWVPNEWRVEQVESVEEANVIAE
jgi:transcription initiation factor IIE alpha subunit